MNKLTSIKFEILNYSIESSIKPIFLYAVIALFVFFKIFDLSNYNIAYPFLVEKIDIISNIIRFTLITYFVFYWIISGNQLNYLLLFFCFIIISFLSLYFSHTWLIFDLFFVPLFLMRFLEEKLFFKVIFFTSFSAFFLIIILNYCDVLYSPILHYRGDYIRYTFGFMHPNSLGFCIVLLCLYTLLTIRNHILIKFLFFIGSAFFCYYYPNSFTSLFVILLLSLICLISSIIKKFEFLTYSTKNLSVIITLVFFCIIGFAFLATFTDLLNGLIEKLPGAISARFSLGRIAFSKYDISFWGTPMRIITEYQQVILGIRDSFFTVDCGYFFLLIQYGVFNFIIYTFLFTFSICKAVKHHNLLAAFLCVVLALYGVSEIVILSPLFMPVFAYCLHDKNK